MTNANEMMQVLLDQVASGQLSRRRFLTVAGATGLAAAIVRAIEAARELGSKTAFDSIREAEVIPGSKATSRPDLIAFARTASASFGHAVGTAKIGTGADAVVDSELRVHGLQGLRVADASVMPSIPSGPTNAPSFMIGGRAAELIKAAK